MGSSSPKPQTDRAEESLEHALAVLARREQSARRVVAGLLGSHLEYLARGALHAWRNSQMDAYTSEAGSQSVDTELHKKLFALVTHRERCARHVIISLLGAQQVHVALEAVFQSVLHDVGRQ